MQEELATSSAFGGPGGFIGLGSTPAMTAALEAIGIQRPTYIQSASIQVPFAAELPFPCLLNETGQEQEATLPL